MKRLYVTPSVETLDVCIEKGFMASVGQANSTEDVNETFGGDWEE